MAKIYTKQELWNEALESLKYEATLSKLLKKSEQRLEAIICLGRIYQSLNNSENALKVFKKGKYLSDKINQSNSPCYNHIHENFYQTL